MKLNDTNMAYLMIINDENQKFVVQLLILQSYLELLLVVLMP